MKNVFKLNVAASAAVVSIMMTAGLASAQQASAGTSGQVGMALPGAAPQATATTGGSDHDQVVNRLGVGYMGRHAVPIGTSSTASVEAPTIGVRYWVNQMIGVDVGLGIGMHGGTTNNQPQPPGTTIDDQGATAFLIHGGVPLSLASAGHFSFQIIPEMNLGVAWASSPKQPGNPPPGPNHDYSGFLFDIGARAGAEIQFGFMGIPQLSLQGSVGLLYAMESRKDTTKAYNNNPESSTSHSTWRLNTTVNDNPWNIFTSNVAAIYYF